MVDTAVSASLSMTGAITVPGALDKRGDGTRMLTDGDSHAGGTTTLGGLLQLGDGGAAGAILGDVASDGTLQRRQPLEEQAPE
jgi:fibronectin-binding autotransporter adhesin